MNPAAPRPAAPNAGNQDPAALAVAAFRTRHRRTPVGVWSAPGRVNLIGEHTDYNDGLVLPFALPYRIAVAAGPRADGLLTVTTVGGNGRPQHAAPVRVADLAPGSVTGWAAYPAGIAWVLQSTVDGAAVRAGADLVIAGNVPSGAGLSSSAALECATALALLGLAGADTVAQAHDTSTGTEIVSPARRMEIAQLAHRAENEFVGAPTGLLDQAAALCCVPGHVLLLDIRSGVTEQIPFRPAAAGLTMLVLDTGTRHALADSEYALRRSGCERAAALLGVPALRDITPADLTTATAALPQELRPLVRHVVTENDRVRDVVALLRDSRIDRIGPALTSSHESLRWEYRVTSPELDVTMEVALDSGALGARMTGGGFGGCVIALVPDDRVAEVRSAVTAAFAGRGWQVPRCHRVSPSAGAGRDL